MNVTPSNILGAKMHYNMKVGRDITLTELQQKYDAVFIGVGLWKSRELPIPGADAPDIIRGIEYLRVRCVGEKWKIGENLIVIGGGNVAFDVARTSVRNGAKNITMVCLESRDEQTADEFEIEDGMEEGITIHNRLAPLAVEGQSREESLDYVFKRSIHFLIILGDLPPNLCLIQNLSFHAIQ